MRKRLRVVGAPEPVGPLTQLPRPVVAAKPPTPIVESATISIDEIVICAAAASKAVRPSIVGTPGAAKMASSVYEATHAVGSGSSKAAARASSAARMPAISDGESATATTVQQAAALREPIAVQAPPHSPLRAACRQ